VSSSAPGDAGDPSAPPSSPRTIVAPGEDGGDLYLGCHLEVARVKAQLAGQTRDAVVVERWGEGTHAYKPVVEGYGGFARWVADIAAACEKEAFGRVCLTTWSAGSQVAKEVCKGDDWPDALVMLDGLYGDKPDGAAAGDGQVVMDEGLEAIARYAVSAANGERTLAIVHSRIPTPYGSSFECAQAVRCCVERQLGEPLAPDPSASRAALGSFTGAWSAGGFHLVEFPGTTGAEHTREGALFRACWRLWLAW
jgi:hypothetical protein